MVVTCAFYGFINRTAKVTLQVDREKLEVGQSFVFEGGSLCHSFGVRGRRSLSCECRP